VFFRAASVHQAIALLSGMAGLRGVEHDLPVSTAAVSLGVAVSSLLHAFGARLVDVQTNIYLWHAVRVVAGFAIVWWLPNTQQIMAAARPILGKMPPLAPRLLQWRPTIPWAFTVGFAAVAVLLQLGGTAEFLYFQF